MQSPSLTMAATIMRTLLRSADLLRGLFSCPVLIKFQSLTPVHVLRNRRMLEWQPRPREDTIVETAESLLRLGLVKGQ